MNSHLIVALLLALVAGVGLYAHFTHKNNLTYKTDDPAIIDAFNQFLNKYGKSYGHDEHYYRYVNFKNNYKWIENHNGLYKSGKKTYYLGINQFADLDNTEFKRIYLGLAKKTTPNKNDFLVSSVPNSVDWRDKNAVTGVKNQGQCGSCWAFSTVGSLEGLHAISSGTLTSFSEQQLVDCSGSYGNMGCNGGLMDYAFQYVRDHGITTESAYPYKGVDGSCKSFTSAFKNKGYNDVPANSESQMKAALGKGPVSVAIEADGYDFQLYSGGVFDDSSCGTGLDHGVLAVGYGTESGKEYYIVKNSWGGSWGLSGYIKMAINGDGPGMCGIQMQASYPTL